MVEPLSLEEFLDKKRDYSPFLVHLTKDGVDVLGDPCVSARDVLDTILSEKTLKAYNHFCLFSLNLNESKDDNLQDKFKVVCFTETPIEQIDVLLAKVTGRAFKPQPYGLVFQKKYVRIKRGNPIFYATKEIAKPLWQSYWPLCNGSIQQSSEELCKLLALVSVCEEGNDWHWEREWRIVGDLEFNPTDIYCGLCPENDISYFERNYKPVKFISPKWGIRKILDRLVGK